MLLYADTIHPILVGVILISWQNPTYFYFFPSILLGSMMQSPMISVAFDKYDKVQIGGRFAIRKKYAREKRGTVNLDELLH